MSINLHLCMTTPNQRKILDEFPLVQVPSDASIRAANRPAEAKQIYCRHLRENVWPWDRGSYQGRKNQAEMATHMNELHRWMQTHPDARWLAW